MTSEKGIWFISDLHFNHKLCANLRGYDGDVEAMNEVIITIWNSYVQEHDRVYLLGDVSLKDQEKTFELLHRLNGKIYLIRGNHEKIAESSICRVRFEWIKDVYMLKVKDDHEKFSQHGKVNIWLSHYAHRVWPKSHYGALHLYGHSHGNLPDDPRILSMDVGIDAEEPLGPHIPISYESVLEKMMLKDWICPVNRRDELKPLTNKND